MSEQEIFTKLIQNVIDKGWTPFLGIEKGFKWKYENGNIWISAPIWDFKQEKMVTQLHARNIEGVIFDLEFARLIWGNEWKERLQELVISENRVIFLSQFVK